MHMETQTPDWLAVTATSTEQSPATANVAYGEPVAKTRADLALMELQHQAAFEPLLDRITLGHSLADILSDRPEGSYIHKGALMRWIRADPDRIARFREAQEIGTELIEDEMIAIADAENTLEDVARSKLRIDTRKDVLGFRNRKRYSKDAVPSNPFASGNIVINISPVTVDGKTAPNAEVIDV